MKVIEHKNLSKQLGSIKRQSEWLRACEKLGFRISHGGKHPYIIRDPENLNNADFKSSVTTIPGNLHPVINQKIFKQILNSPISVRMNISEESILDALGF